jgi:hypothetical protein
VAAFEDRLRRAGVAPLADRHLVVAVGSNACVGVMARKLGPAPIPLVLVRIRGVRAGHSAHVSVRGYVPAAPFVDPGAETGAVAAWVDDVQLAVLDRSEPNYHRVRLSPPLRFEDDGAWDGWEVYVSDHGVLAPDGTGPLPLGSQDDILGRYGDSRVVVGQLAASAGRRAALVRSWREDGWVVDAGLDASPAPDASPDPGPGGSSSR